MLQPVAVAFDVIETTYSIETLRPRLKQVGLAPETLDVWFATGLRDAFAMAATETYAPFAAVLIAALKGVADKSGVVLTEAQAQSVVSGFAELDPHPDAAAAFDRLSAAGVRIVTLTNGSAEATKALLERAGLLDRVERIITTDEVRAFKPCARVYRHAAAALGLPPERLALIAAHGWDVHGAKCAGLATGFVARGARLPELLRRPDVEGRSLLDVVEKLLKWPPG